MLGERLGGKVGLGWAWIDYLEWDGMDHGIHWVGTLGTDFVENGTRKHGGYIIHLSTGDGSMFTRMHIGRDEEKRTDCFGWHYVLFSRGEVRLRDGIAVPYFDGHRNGYVLHFERNTDY